MKGLITYEAANDAITSLAFSHFLAKPSGRARIGKKQEELLIAKCLQGRSWSDAARSVDTDPSKVKIEIRDLIKSLWRGYVGEAA